MDLQPSDLALSSPSLLQKASSPPSCDLRPSFSPDSWVGSCPLTGHASLRSKQACYPDSLEPSCSMGDRIFAESSFSPAMVGPECRYTATTSTALGSNPSSESAPDMNPDYDTLVNCQTGISHVPYVYGGAYAPNYSTPRASPYLDHESPRFADAAFTRDCHAGLDRRMKSGQRDMSLSESAYGSAAYSVGSTIQASYSTPVPAFPISPSSDEPIRTGSLYRSQVCSNRPTPTLGHLRSQASPAAASSTSIVTRTRRVPRKHTTKEEANFQCSVQGCGKFFSRSYNYKSHMETHDEQREYPFPCLVGGCSKKFVRKTDLQRHHQSVHKKERNHGCDFCGRLFARKDTLRRHMEDGCSKRFDIETLDLRADSLHALSPTDRGARHSMSRNVTAAKLLPPTPASLGQLPVLDRLTQGDLKGHLVDRAWGR